MNRAHLLRGAAGAAVFAGVPAVVRAAPTLNVGQIGQTSICFFPLFVAQRRGFFKDEGIDVAITALQTGAVVGAALTSGSLDVGCSVITDVFALLKAQRPVRIAGSLVNGYYVDVTGSTAFLAAAKVSRSSPLRARVEALRGKRVGITGPGSGTQALVQYLFARAGLDATRDVELVNSGTDQAAILAALRGGRLDAVSFAWPFSMVAQAEGGGEPLIMPALGDVPSMKNQVQGVFYARPQTLAARRDDVARFTRAIARAEALIHEQNGARALLEEYDRQLDPQAMTRLLAAYLPVLPERPVVPRDGYERALAFHKATGFATNEGTAYDQVVDSGAR